MRPCELDTARRRQTVFGADKVVRNDTRVLRIAVVRLSLQSPNLLYAEYTYMLLSTVVPLLDSVCSNAEHEIQVIKVANPSLPAYIN